jgi:hypothetical protein
MSENKLSAPNPDDLKEQDFVFESLIPVLSFQLG